jgi:hypothetical protein
MPPAPQEAVTRVPSPPDLPQAPLFGIRQARSGRLPQQREMYRFEVPGASANAGVRGFVSIVSLEFFVCQGLIEDPRWTVDNIVQIYAKTTAPVWRDCIIDRLYGHLGRLIFLIFNGIEIMCNISQRCLAKTGVTMQMWTAGAAWQGESLGKPHEF